jgi:hypothetical protein
MQSIPFIGMTHELGKPSSWDEEQHGKCALLPVKMADGIATSKWVPTDEELEALNRGGCVVLEVVGGQPAVRLTVQADQHEEPVG